MAKNKPGKKPREKIRAVLPSGLKESSFFEQVYELARQIPSGRVTSYGALAAALGARSSARMVGWAMNNAHNIQPSIPAHRVVNRQGLLTGKHHFKDPEEMERLLMNEGIIVENNQVKDFKKHFWDPSSIS